MPSTIKILGIVCLLLAVHVSHGQRRQEKGVKKSFDAYKSALLKDKGEEAVKYVDSRTIQYYGNMLEHVKNADSSTVETLSILDKLMVLAIRHRTSKSDILSFEGTSLLVYAITSGMVGKNSVANNSIGEVLIEQDFAKAQLIANGQKAPFYFHFYNEDDLWKIDLTALFPISTVAFQKMADDSGENENDFLFAILENITGNKPGPEIWQPVR